MYKGKFERTRPNINIGTIGHVHRGRTTLIGALAAVLAPQIQLLHKHEHVLEARINGMRRCVVCNGADSSLPSDCPGATIDSNSLAAIIAGELDFKAGAWSGKAPTPTNEA